MPSLNNIFYFQFSWKLLHPTNHSENRSCPEEAEAYEKVIGFKFLISLFASQYTNTNLVLPYRLLTLAKAMISYI